MMMLALREVSYFPVKTIPLLHHRNNHNSYHILKGTSIIEKLQVDGTSRTLHNGVPIFTLFAAKNGGFSLKSVFNRCDTCRGQGAIECPGCKGTGKNKKNGNIFERWKCFECQGFGLKSCPNCGRGGLTPEQRGER